MRAMTAKVQIEVLTHDNRNFGKPILLSARGWFGAQAVHESLFSNNCDLLLLIFRVHYTIVFECNPIPVDNTNRTIDTY